MGAPPTGFDPMHAGMTRSVGVQPTFKAPEGSLPAQIGTSWAEIYLNLWMEMHPHIKVFGRIDVHPDFAKAYGIKPVPGFEVCTALRTWDGSEAGWYLGDAGAVLDVDGVVGAFMGEAKRKGFVATSHDRAAFAAAREYVGPTGSFGLLIEGDLPRRWFWRTLWLHGWRFAYRGPDGILDDMADAWANPSSARSLIRRFRGRADKQILLHAAWKTLGDALAAGRLPVDLARAEFDLDTETRILRPGAPLILPHALRSEAPDAPAGAKRYAGPSHVNTDYLDGDESSAFHVRKGVMLKIRAGDPAARFADTLGCTDRWVQLLYKDWLARGDVALTDNEPVSRRGTTLEPEVQTYLEGRLRSHPLLRGHQLVKDGRFRRWCDRNEFRVPKPRRINHFIELLAERDPAIGTKVVGRSRPSPAGAVGWSAILEGRPGFVVQGDEEVSNLMAQVAPKLADTTRVHRFPMSCVGTGVPLSLATSLKAIDQGDVRLALIRCASDKTPLAKRAGCEHDWDTRAWPFLLALDNAFVSRCYMLVKKVCRLGMFLLLVPAGRPQSKAREESDIGRDQKLMEDDLEHSVQRHPSVRGDAKPEQWAARHAIDLDEVEKDFIANTVDAVLHGYTDHGDYRPITEWTKGARRFGVRMLDPRELADELRTPLGERTVSSMRVSHDDRDFVETWAGDDDDDPRNDLPFSAPRSGFLIDAAKILIEGYNDDARTIAVVDQKGNVVGALVDNKTSLKYGRAVSQLEIDIDRIRGNDDRKDGRASRERSRERTRDKNANRPAKRVTRDASNVEHARRRHEETVYGDRGRPPRQRRPRRPRPAAPPNAPQAQPGPRERVDPPTIRFLDEELGPQGDA